MVTTDRTQTKRALPSDAVYRAGYSRAPARSYLRAMGLTDADIAKPFVGVVSSWNEATPCNIALDRWRAGRSRA